MHVRQDIVSVGVNRVVNAVDWSNSGLVAYGAHTMVALYEPQSAKVLATMLGHTGTVYCVRWISRAGTAALAAAGPSPHAQLLVSGSEDATLRVWQVHASELVQAAQPSTHPQQQPWSQVAVIQGHTGAVTDIAWAALPSCAAAPDCSDTCLTGPPPPDPSPAAHGGSSSTLVAGSRRGAGSRGGGLLLASCGGDASVCVWQLGGQGEVEGQGGAAPAAADPSAPAAPLPWRLAQRLAAGGHIQHALALTHLPGQPDWLLLATGGTDARVHLFIRPPPGPAGGAGAFQPSAVLAGHENWIRSLAFCHCCTSLPGGRQQQQQQQEQGGQQQRGGGHEGHRGASREGAAGGGQLLLASASQDRYGRIWAIQQAGPGAVLAAAGPGGADPLADLMRYAPRPQLQAAGCCYDVTLESLLVGHEDWVHSVRWQPRVQIPAGGPPGGLGAEGPEGAPGLGGLPPKTALCLLTASMDRTMALWVPERGSGLWMNVASVGDAGAACLGYFGGVWGPQGKHLLAHGFTGALHLWEHPPSPSPSPPGPHPPAASSHWEPRHALGGHWDAVRQVAWGCGGRVLASVSDDQTARLFACLPAPPSFLHSGSPLPPTPAAGAADSAAGGPGNPEEAAAAGGRQEQQQQGADDCIPDSATDMEAAGKLPQNGVAGPASKTNQPGVLATDAAAVEHWCEIGRPQVHGHDFSCLAFLPHGTLAASYAYACGSEEKVVRVMEAPRVFLDTLDSLQPLAGPLHPAATPATREVAGGAGGSPQGQGSGPWAGQAGVPGRRARGYGASVSALGLTNKAVEQGEGQGDNALGAGSGLQLPGVGAGGYEDGPDFAPHAAPCAVSTPPLEEHLAQNTLWPEGHKLYGHGDLVYCAAASPDGALLASACVAKASPRAAAVWVWDVAGDTWRGVAQLEAHTLTVTQLAWSHSGRWLASCSRDRSWAVHQRRSCAESASGPAPHSFRLVHRQKAAHARIIWGCAWSNDDRLLATGARDGLIKIWDTAPLAAAADDSSLCADWTTPCEPPPKLPNAPLLTLPPFPSAVTALAFMPGAAASPHVLAVGLEDGALQLWSIPSQSSVEGPARCLWRSDPLNGHAAQVSSVAWRDCGDCCQLATGSHDHSVRVFTVSLQ